MTSIIMKEDAIRPRELFDEYLRLSREDVETFFSDQSAFQEVPCPACDDSRRDGGFEKLAFRYQVCAGCGSLYVSPRPRPKLVDEYYRRGKAVQFWTTHFYRETAEARREKIFKPRAMLVAELLNRFGDRYAQSFADIGAGYGIFLEEVKELGRFKTIRAIEPGPDLAAVCREKGFEVVEKPAENVGEGECSSTFATAFELLEHVYSPLEFLRAVRRIVNRDGLFLFTTLTVSGFDIQVLWDKSKSVYPPHHINLLSVDGMRRLVERSGFRLIELTTPGQLDVDIVANYVRDNPSTVLPRFVSSLLRAGETVRNDFQSFLSRNLLSSHIRVIASNP
ncbi:MAG TPA: class I SAM-dependent methyltransferase [Thermoanaerobaculia bacterium]|nr:class I SAM-dependent methyltransferase [Thermoanaerobaculia bacterium]